MQFAIPHAPRRVRFFQVPGAVGRLVRTLLLGLLFMAVLGAGAAFAGRFFVKERSFFIRSEEVVGLVADRNLPPKEKRVDAEALLQVLYSVDGVQYTVSGVRTSAEYAEGLGHGAQVTLLVDPAGAEAVALGQAQGGVEAGEAAADHADRGLAPALQWRTLVDRRQRGAVIAVGGHRRVGGRGRVC